MSTHPATIATPGYLDQIKNTYTFPRNSPENNSWYIIAAVAFSASNRPEEVGALAKYLLQLPEFQEHQLKLKVVRRLREALFKSGSHVGWSRTINGLVSLFEVTPEELKETKMIREVRTMEDYTQIGEEEWLSAYGDSAAKKQKLLDDIYPDLGYFCTAIAYGLIYTTSPSVHTIATLTRTEAAYVNVTSLIAVDTPRQVAWHLDGARRNGATIEEIEKARELSMEVASKCGIVWRDGVPEVNKGELK